MNTQTDADGMRTLGWREPQTGGGGGSGSDSGGVCTNTSKHKQIQRKFKSNMAGCVRPRLNFSTTNA